MKKTIYGILMIFLLVLTACQTSVNLPNLPSEQGDFDTVFSADQDIGTLKFKSVDELNAFLKQHESSGGMYYRGGGVMMEFASMSADGGDSMAKSVPFRDTDYSG